jgi:hypothetical protein
LRFDPKCLSFLLSSAHFFLEHDAALDCLVVLLFHVFQRRLGIPLLSLVVVIGDLGVAQSQIQFSVRLSKLGDFLLQRILSIRRFHFRLLVFRLPLLDLILQVGGLVLPLPFALFGCLDVFF